MPEAEVGSRAKTLVFSALLDSEVLSLVLLAQPRTLAVASNVVCCLVSKTNATISTATIQVHVMYHCTWLRISTWTQIEYLVQISNTEESLSKGAHQGWESYWTDVVVERRAWQLSHRPCIILFFSVYFMNLRDLEHSLSLFVSSSFPPLLRKLSLPENQT